MQDITSEHCTNTAEGFEKQLKDTRDGQLYWVGKMKDGRCWMLQNLALGSTSSATALTSANSNVTSDWTLPKSYTSVASGSESNTAVQSWYLGKWVLATPLLTTSCGTATAFASCTKVGFVDVSSSNFSSGYTATTKNWDGANSNSSTLAAVNCTSWSGSGTSKICTAGTYDPHYLVGNYYSWNAATAGTGGTITSGQASGSICPKGWKLPTSNSTAAGSFGGLLSKYGVDSNLDSGTYNIASKPLVITRSGRIGAGSSIIYLGQNGHYWSSTANSSKTYAYQFAINDSGVHPSNVGDRQYGFSVRCVSQ